MPHIFCVKKSVLYYVYVDLLFHLFLFFCFVLSNSSHICQSFLLDAHVNWVLSVCNFIGKLTVTVRDGWQFVYVIFSVFRQYTCMFCILLYVNFILTYVLYQCRGLVFGLLLNALWIVKCIFVMLLHF